MARQYKSKEFMNHARKQLAKDPHQIALLSQSKKAPSTEGRSNLRRIETNVYDLPITKKKP